MLNLVGWIIEQMLNVLIKTFITFWYDTTQWYDKLIWNSTLGDVTMSLIIFKLELLREYLV
jgi:hypothetical protein